MWGENTKIIFIRDTLLWYLTKLINFVELEPRVFKWKFLKTVWSLLNPVRYLRDLEMKKEPLLTRSEQ